MFVPDKAFHYIVMLHSSFLGPYVSYEENSVVNMALDLKFTHLESEQILAIGDQCKKLQRINTLAYFIIIIKKSFITLSTNDNIIKQYFLVSNAASK